MDSSKLDERRPKIVIWAFIVQSVLLCFVYAGSHTGHEVADFVSYMGPCAAGVVAGCGLYLNRSNKESADRLFYWIAMFLLYTGLVGYVFAHKNCQLPAIALIGLALSGVSGWLFLEKIVSRGPHNGRWHFLDGLFAQVVGVCLPTVLAAGAVAFPSFFSWRSGFLCLP